MSRPFRNRLNDMTTKEWIKFQKSWFIHNPPRRRKDVLRHPAKFPETLVEEFIEFFTKEGQIVLDPMVGTGSSLVAALRQGRAGIGVELNPEYARIAQQVVQDEAAELERTELDVRVFQGNAAAYPALAAQHDLPQADYLITSPPYWDMLHARGSQTQKTRREDGELDVVYSADSADLGNVSDYDEFVERLVAVYAGIQPYLRERAYLTIIVKNVKKKGKIYPLAWDLAAALGRIYTLKDEKIWLQDNIRLAPYGMGNAWVSNTFHHYCLQFRND
jgi:hypothetical protein